MAVSPDDFAWSQTSASRRYSFNVYEQAMPGDLPSGRIFRVSVPNSQRLAGGIAGTRLAYEQDVGKQVYIRFWNLALWASVWAQLTHAAI